MAERPIRDYTINFLIETINGIRATIKEDKSNDGDDKDSTLGLLDAMHDSLMDELNE